MTEQVDLAGRQPGDTTRVYRNIVGRTILFDNEGFLWDPADWSEELSVALAAECGLHELSEVHWKVIRFLREFARNYGRTPLNRQVRDGTGLSLLQLESLFPGGIKMGARRIAGLPNPKSCA